MGGMSKLRFCGFHVLWDAIHYLHKYDSEIYSTEHSMIETKLPVHNSVIVLIEHIQIVPL